MLACSVHCTTVYCDDDNKYVSLSDSTEDDFSVIQQEIVIVKSCKHPNIVAYYGSYIR